MGMPISVTLSSSGIGRAIDLDWMSSKFTSFAVTGSSSGTFQWTVHGALDDIEQVSSGNVAWFILSSASANSSINIFSGPLAAIRLSVDAASSAAVTLRVLQGVGQ
ncbi:hypothetical protein ABIA99_005268 [Bradyrhizobium sp. LB12.1]|uniref:hypothetical protein n=1 Tax=Bradyrhizobium sp. LB12.1 TaxID=3156327 RepID=UPI003396877B